MPAASLDRPPRRRSIGRVHASVPELTLRGVDVDARHGPGFTIERPAGRGDWTLLHIVTPAILDDRHGRQQCRADACILISPGRPQWLTTVGKEFVNHYAHLDGAGVGPLVAHLGLPLDEVVYPRPIGFLREQLAELRQLSISDEPHASTLASFLIGRLLATLARRLRPAPAGAPDAGRALHDRLKQIRGWLVESPGRHQSAAWIAAQAGISPSHLSATWRRCFGVAPREDIIRLRLERACRLLEDAGMPVADVAERCGFSDPHYFSRLFRARQGCTPTAYASAARTP